MNHYTDSNVYILGAGFSYEMGIPLQNDFLQVAREVYFSDPDKFEHFKSVFEYQDNLTKMRKFLNYDILNLEHLFNLMEMDSYYTEGEEKEKLDTIKADFVKLIEDVINERTPRLRYTNNHGNLQNNQATIQQYLNFIELFIKDKQKDWIHKDTIISFNYDLAVELTSMTYNYTNERRSIIKLNNIIDGSNTIVEDPVDYLNRAGKSIEFDKQIYSGQNNSIPLLKLHGSINWKHKQDTNKALIVPPTWNKSDDRIGRLWKTAQEKLTKAKRIIIIGYSFPDTDIYVKSLIALALNKNEILQNIYFINPDKDTTKKASESLLDTHFHKYCEYKEWTLSQLTNSKEGLKFLKEKLNRKHSWRTYPNP